MRFLTLAAVAGLATSLLAQDPPVLREQFGTVQSQALPPRGPDVPPPPKNLLGAPPKHGMPEVPFGASNVPQPNDPPTLVKHEWQDDADDYRVFSNPNVKPSGASTSNVAEPDAVLADANNGFFTNNWSAARTTNGGSSWSRVNPYSRFPASYGGFCCDQVLATDHNGGPAAWLLQYVRNGSGNAQRIAIADNAGEVGGDNWSRYYDFTAQLFGYPAGDWLDYPDMACSDEFFYVTSNVFNSSSRFQGAVIWRFRIADAVAGGNLSFSFINSSGGSRGASFRLAHGARGDMFIGSHVNTARLRVIKWLNAGGFQTFERDISSWTGGSSPAPGPDGRDWTGRADNRITGGYASEEEVGFVWHVNARTGRPYNYLKLARFDPASVSVIGQRDIWATGVAFMYPAATTNAWGHIGVVCNYGGGNSYPGSCTLLDDELETFGTYRIFATGNSGPDGNRWGDYMAVERHPASAQYGTFYGTGMRQSGGGANGNQVPEFVHFGREAYGASYVALNVGSAPANGVAITLSNDAFGQGNGSTPFLRAYASGASYTATAPATSGGRLFDRWATKSTATSAWFERPVGERTITINIQSIDDAIEARYVTARTLTVRSANPSSGVNIGVSPNDFNGSGNGSTSFTRTYKDGANVTLTAPSSVGCNPFFRWVVNGTAQTSGVRTVSILMDGNETAVAEYRTNVPGSIRNLGAGCRGSNGRVPAQSVSHGNGACGPQQGTPTTYRLRGARPGAIGVLHIGFRTDFWGAFRLPLDLGQFGARGCFLFHDLIVSPNIATSPTGSVDFPITWPVDPAARGLPFHTTYAIVDFGANGLNVVHSNAVSTSQGGTR